MTPPNAVPVHGAGSTVWLDCPNCGYKKSFSVTVKDGQKLFYCHAGCAQSELMTACEKVESSRGLMLHKLQDKAHIQKYALKLWQERQIGREALVPVYLASRSLIGVVPDSLGFLPNHLHKPSGTRWPCMVAAVTNCIGQIQGIHRTYLARDCKSKAPVEPAKMTLGPIGGFACHLAPAKEELVIAEGIETGLSVQFASGIPTWAALNAGNIRSLILPPLPLAAIVTIAADNDPVGIKAAHDAAHRWREEGRRVKIAMPPLGKDFNDVLQEAAQ